MSTNDDTNPSPHFAQRRPSETSAAEAHQQEEEDALLTGLRTGKKEPRTAETNRKWRELGVFAWALLATAGVIVLAVFYQKSLHNTHPSNDDQTGSELPKGKRNLIFMVSDGMGPTSLELTRGFHQYISPQNPAPYNDTLTLDDLLIGQSRTRSSSSLVTDSAAGATAFSCGRKSYNGAISVLPDGSPCPSVMEAAKLAGWTTGVVVTTRVTDATPAVWASHVRRRELEDQIAVQMLGVEEGGSGVGRSLDLIVGGGRCHFLGNGSEGSCRGNGRDLVGEGIREQGWGFVDGREGFDGLAGGKKVELPLLALLAEGDVPYEIDRRFQETEYASLEEMAVTALQALAAATKNSEQGFFVMIEGSRIDHAGHANDPAAQVHEVLAYDRTVKAVLDFIEASETPTLMVSTSDHETGGLAAARQLHEAYPEYLWHPGTLAKASHSAAWAAQQYHAYIANHTSTNNDDNNNKEEEGEEETKTFLTHLLEISHNVTDPSRDELHSLLSHPETAAYTIADMVSRRSQLGWSTHGHSGADVNIYTSDPRLVSRWLGGNRENTEVGQFLERFLEVEEEVERVGEILRERLGADERGREQWLGMLPVEGERLDGQDHREEVSGSGLHRREVGGLDYHVARLAETPGSPDSDSGLRDGGDAAAAAAPGCGFCAR